MKWNEKQGNKNWNEIKQRTSPKEIDSKLNIKFVVSHKLCPNDHT